MKRFILLLLIIPCFMANAQDVITVKGVVTDQTGQTVPGATVLEKGTKNAVVASNVGAYSIKVKPTAILVFSFIGSRSVEEAVQNRTTINAKLLEDANKLNDVVVVGYGAVAKRSDLTGSISSVSGTELEKSPVPNVAQALQGRIAGMQVSMPSGDPEAQPSITIRGGTSITQSNEPLYVVDGVPQTDGLNFLDPSDIETIDVLKDASATSVYGARGANGVILVTTKKIKVGKVSINYDGYVGARITTRYLPVLTPYEYALYAYENNVGNTDGLTRFTNTFGNFNELKSLYENRPGINWQNKVLGEQVMSQYHKIGVSGGSSDMRYNLFYSRNDNDGLLLNSSATKDIAKLTVTNNIGTKAVITGIVNYSRQNIFGTGGTNAGGNAGAPRLSFLQTLLQYRPINGRLDNDLDLLDDQLDVFDNQSNPAFQSPIVALESRQDKRTVNDLNANVTLRYNIVKNLTYNGLGSFSTKGDKRQFFADASNIQSIRRGGPFGNTSELNGNRYSFNNVLTYARTIKNHKFDVALGQEYIYNYSESFSADAANFPLVNNGYNDLGAGTVAGFPSSYAEDDKLFSLFTRANYSYKDRYLFSASLRRDGSSKFGPENVFGYFPAGAFAWKINQESFMKNVKAISDLRLRISYGSSGNNRIPNYAALGTFVSSSYPLADQLNSSVYQTSLSNPFLKWETVVQSNLGLDLGLFKQRLTLTAEVYDNRSKDLLYNSRIPASSGFALQLQNIGETSSRGFELSINSVNFQKKDFTWNTNFNISFNRTKVLKLNGDETSLNVSSWSSTYTDYILRVGSPVGMMYGYLTDGLYQVNDFNYNPTTATYTLKPGVVNNGTAVRPGFGKYKDLSGPGGAPDGIINDFDRTIIGNANPKFTGGINNTFTYKGIDLSIFLDFVYGNNIYNANIANNWNPANDYASNLAFQKDRWTEVDSQGNLLVSPTALGAFNQGKNLIPLAGGTTRPVNDLVIEDGSFLRVNNISLGYNLPKNWLSAVKISRARFYFTAYNLHVFTKYSGYDPEVNVGSSALTRGLDFNAYPRGKSFVAGLNLSL
ncbi:SusC/RagA family TonB-linked outer membrane protein [Pedobacter sp. MC2016-05]|uniref:SusC/RagA family TonB-linked outer membrane protein n=1 Tax=Pedobacter sp. MC2016-05 TaxID=2994474 RepID=UPI002245F6E3|nr:TonB-dependent receptor [Pedobacter sp. MC2016-05]